MKELYMKQKLLRMNGQFTVKDGEGKDVYEVEGSFLKIPKTYTIRNAANEEIATITKKTFSFLPVFTVHAEGQEMVTIRKEFTFLKPRYTIDAVGVEVTGSWWEMSFDVLKDGNIVGTVNKKWFQWGDSYQIQVVDETMETFIISLVLAIDCVKADESAASAAAF